MGRIFEVVTCGTRSEIARLSTRESPAQILPCNGASLHPIICRRPGRRAGSCPHPSGICRSDPLAGTQLVLWTEDTEWPELQIRDLHTYFSEQLDVSPKLVGDLETSSAQVPESFQPPS
jgi:hypothetical protein